MPAYKNDKVKKKGKWTGVANWTDGSGTHHQKKKSGFQTKKEALKWVEDYKRSVGGSVDMLFSDFVTRYFNDLKTRIKETTYYNKVRSINKHIVPYFGDKKVSEITPLDVREWQNSLIESGLAPTTLKTLHSHLSSLFNFAVKFYGLKENPCAKAGSIGKTKRETIDFWTLDEFKEFIACVDDPHLKAAYDTLYYTGLRIGELLALTPDDIDTDNRTISVTKTCERVAGKGMVIMPPKTKKSTREISIPESLAKELKDLIEKTYGISGDGRLFPYSNFYYRDHLIKVCKDNGLRRIRLHDIRHSHASLLIELGCSPVMVQERLGHENVEMTLGTYSHLYPNKQSEIANKLDDLFT